MKCPVCSLKVRKVYKVIKGVKIYECKKCEFGFVRNSTTLIRPLQSCNGLYNFEEYKKQENRLIIRYEKLVNDILNYKTKGKVLDIGTGFGLLSSILNKKGNFHFDLIEPDIEPYYFNPPSRKSLPTESGWHTEPFPLRQDFSSDEAKELNSRPLDYGSFKKEINKKNNFKLYKTSFDKFITLTKNPDRDNLSVGNDLGRYDLIIVMDVIEHFEDPLDNLKRVKLLLKKDGILVIQTPNYKSLMAKICKDWVWWMVEDHKFFFSPKSIRLLLEKAGFKTIRLETYEDFYEFKKNLDGNFVGMKNGFIRKLTKVLFLSLFVPFYFFVRKLIWKLECGGLIFVIAVKTNYPFKNSLAIK